VSLLKTTGGDMHAHVGKVGREYDRRKCPCSATWLLTGGRRPRAPNGPRTSLRSTQTCTVQRTRGVKCSTPVSREQWAASEEAGNVHIQWESKRTLPAPRVTNLEQAIAAAGLLHAQNRVRMAWQAKEAKQERCVECAASQASAPFVASRETQFTSVSTSLRVYDVDSTGPYLPPSLARPRAPPRSDSSCPRPGWST
jgi:hypothetical protein